MAKITINGITDRITCKSVSMSGTTPSSGLGPVPIGLSFSGCTDDRSGTDTITISSTNGSWLLTFIDSTAANEETQAEPNTGDQLRLTIPQAAASFTLRAFPLCTVTVAPSGSANVNGSYDDVNTWSINGVSIPVSGSGCMANSFTLTATFKFTPGIQDVS